jgi:PKHD-type hydroxylase
MAAAADNLTESIMLNATAIRPPEKPAFPTHIQWSGDNVLLSQPECEWVIARGEGLKLEPASVGTPTDQRVEPATRCVSAATFDMKDAGWLYDRLSQRISWANQAHYDFDLTGLVEPIQFLKYTAGKTPEDPNGHYVWHVDFGEGAMATRKLSIVVQLSPPTAYDGCDFAMMGDRGHQILQYRGQGDAFMFPSWTPHMVAPITRGMRYALVAWIHGPRFR